MEYIGVCLGVEDHTVTANAIWMNLLRRIFDSMRRFTRVMTNEKENLGDFWQSVGQKERLTDEMFKFVFGWVLEVRVNIVLGVEWFSK